jgi:hypothetical protein
LISVGVHLRIVVIVVVVAYRCADYQRSLISGIKASLAHVLWVVASIYTGIPSMSDIRLRAVVCVVWRGAIVHVALLGKVVCAVRWRGVVYSVYRRTVVCVALWRIVCVGRRGNVRLTWNEWGSSRCHPGRHVLIRSRNVWSII